MGSSPGRGAHPRRALRHKTKTLSLCIFRPACRWSRPSWHGFLSGTLKKPLKYRPCYFAVLASVPSGTRVGATSGNSMPRKRRPPEAGSMGPVESVLP